MKEIKYNDEQKQILVNQLKNLNEEDRRDILRNFCSTCLRYTGPDEKCFCWNDK